MTLLQLIADVDDLVARYQNECAALLNNSFFTMMHFDIPMYYMCFHSGGKQDLRLRWNASRGYHLRLPKETSILPHNVCA